MIEHQKATFNDILESVNNRAPSFGDYLGAQMSEAFNEGTTTGVALHAAKIKKEEMTQDELKEYEDESEFKSSEYFREGMSFKEGLSVVQAKIDAQAHDESMYRKSIISRYDAGIGGTIAGFGAAMIGSLPDPINLIPFAGISTKGVAALRLAKTVNGAKKVKAVYRGAKAVKNLSTGAKITGGIADGSLGNLAVSAVTRPFWAERGIESTWQDYVFDTMVGGALGGTLTGASAIIDTKYLKRNLPAKHRNVLAKQVELDMREMEVDGHISDTKVDGYKEAKKALFDLEEVKQSEHKAYLEEQLVKSGLSPEEATHALTPAIAHAQAFAKYYEMDFNTFLKEKVIKELNVDDIDLNTKRLDELIDSEIDRMFDEVQSATQGKRQGHQSLNNADGEGYIQNFNTTEYSTFPEWYADFNVKNKAEFKKIYNSKKGKRYERMREIAQNRLENGYEQRKKVSKDKTEIIGGDTPNNEYRKLMGLDPANQNDNKLPDLDLSNTKEELPFFQNKNKKHKGSVAIKNGEKIVSLFQSSDKSTFLHETGHIFLENLQELSLKEDAPDFAKKDFKVIQKYLGMKGKKITRAQHEKFARSFEEYLREGVAPSSSLGRAFEAFKDWLTSIYKSDKDLKAGISPEVRRVFDDLLGTNEFDIPSSKIISEIDEGFSRLVSDSDIAEMEARADRGELQGLDLKIYEQAVKEVDVINTKIEQIEKVEEAFVLFQSEPEELISHISKELDISSKEAQDLVDEVEATGRLKEIKLFNEHFSEFSKKNLQERIKTPKEMANIAKGISDKSILSKKVSKDIRDLTKGLNADNPVLTSRIREYLLDYADLYESNLKMEELELATRFHTAKIINKQMKARLEDAAFTAKKRAVQTIIAKNQNRADIDLMINAGASPDEAILALLEGRAELRGVNGSGNSVDARRQAIEGYYVNEMDKRIRDVSENAYARLEEDKLFNSRIIEEFWALDNPHQKGLVTGDIEAYEISKSIKKLADENRERVNAAGSDVGYLKNWAPQSHSQDALIKAGREEWKSFLLQNNLIDLDRTFGVKNLDKSTTKFVNDSLDRIYEKLALGHAEDITDALDDVTPIDAVQALEKDISGPTTANIAKRLDNSRSIFFKDGKAQVKYQESFGDKNIVVGIFEYLQRGARTLALTEKLGANPEFTLNLLIKDIKDEISNGSLLDNLDVAKREKAISNLPSPQQLARRESQIGKAVKIALGEHLTPENSSLASISGMVRGVQTLSKLGAATLSQLADMVNATNERVLLRDTAALDEWSQTLQSFFKHGDDSHKKIINRLGIIVDGMLAQNVNRWSVDEGANRSINNATNFMFKINGMNWLTNKMKSSHALAVAADMSDMVTKSYKDLPLGYREGLEQYGKFNPLKWDVIRKSPLDEAQGNFYLTPESIKDISDDALELLIPEKYHIKQNTVANMGKDPKVIDVWSKTRNELLKRARVELETDYRTFLIETTRNAVLEPDARTSRYTTQGLNRGTAAGEAIRFFMQFKSFGITQAHRIMAGKRFRRSGYEKDLKNTSQYFATALALGYMSLALKDISKGREPRDMTKYSTFLEAAAQSGGAGILGDVVFNSNNRFGGSAMASFMGPTFGMVDQAMDIKGRIQQSNKDNAGDYVKDIGAASLNLVKQNMPFNSLFYTREIANHLFWYHLKEQVSPGSTRRMERRMSKENNQEMFLSPTKAWGY